MQQNGASQKRLYTGWMPATKGEDHIKNTILRNEPPQLLFLVART